jgi:hypothetical protein
MRHWQSEAAKHERWVAGRELQALGEATQHSRLPSHRHRFIGLSFHLIRHFISTYLACWWTVRTPSSVMQCTGSEHTNSCSITHVVNHLENLVVQAIATGILSTSNQPIDLQVTQQPPEQQQQHMLDTTHGSSSITNVLRQVHALLASSAPFDSSSNLVKQRQSTSTTTLASTALLHDDTRRLVAILLPLIDCDSLLAHAQQQQQEEEDEADQATTTDTTQALVWQWQRLASNCIGQPQMIQAIASLPVASNTTTTTAKPSTGDCMTPPSVIALLVRNYNLLQASSSTTPDSGGFTFRQVLIMRV